MNEELQLKNLVTIADFPADQVTFEDLKELSRSGKSLSDYPGCNILGTFQNLVMARWKDQYTLDLWDQATKVLITNQTSAPIPTETTPTSGIIYTVTSDWETNRIRGNPYHIAYGITAPEADGQWGSLCWVTESGDLMNRVRTPIRKDSGKILFLELKARIT